MFYNLISLLPTENASGGFVWIVILALAANDALLTKDSYVYCVSIQKRRAHLVQTASWLISGLSKSSNYSIHDENRTITSCIFLLDFKLSLYVSGSNWRRMVLLPLLTRMPVSLNFPRGSSLPRVPTAELNLNSTFSRGVACWDGAS